MSKEIVYKDLIAFHPGSYVEDIIDELNITQVEFAGRLGTSPKTISKIINGEDNISNDIANKLAKITGISVKTWINLQTNYDLKVIEIENKKDKDEEKIVSLIAFDYFKKNRFVYDKKYSIQEKIKTLRKLLRISDLSQLSNLSSSVSYRNTQAFSEKSIVNSNVMLELAIDEARNFTENKYTKNKLIEALPSIRKMSLEEPKEFYPKLKKILLECGIVLVGLPKLTNANLNGATKKFKNGSVLLLITDRNKRSDIFWFSLIHELGHIYNDDFYSDYKDDNSYKLKEETADRFALDFYIPQNVYDEFVKNGDFTKHSIDNFANNLGILPSIVVGRLQKDDYVSYKNKSLNSLKHSYSIVRTR
ncbi:HigA family addiction module antitoxin [Companilactobacillus allii]|uniref:Addiction module antidote protein, HigA family n=1 Tax=Companilactobacillus allii TaxID=1847728 RepID=A0A1P8Q1G6_9LACO|nr:HigA family addiction module antitoxin [Companilactobacillus allii]APX71724.1 addiction module antidote protein, HigA family [Companilactobacillus allii]USQ68812.1 HigA family addiction module antitoxin [Companilactobacillus allii]